MKRLGIGILFLLSLIVTGYFAIAVVSSITPTSGGGGGGGGTVSSGAYGNLTSYYDSIDYSCSQDSDCLIKDVHNCCGYYPQCTNKNAEVNPVFVSEACKNESVIGTCGFPSINVCRCDTIVTNSGESTKCMGHNVPTPNVTQCTTNADCPSVSGKQYCKESNLLCGAVSTYSCIEGKCVSNGGGLGCKVCTNGCSDGACILGNISQVKEQVKCVFDDSIQEQKCYTTGDNSRAYCSGRETCVADISGFKGEKITWKSSCGGYAYTIMDGENEYAKFKCGSVLNSTCESYKCDDGSVAECKIVQGGCMCNTCPPIIVKPVCGNGICEGGEGEVCKTTLEVAMCEAGKECKSPPSECFVVCPQDCKTTEPIYPSLDEKFRFQVYQSAKIRENGADIIKITFKDLIAYKCAGETTNSLVVKEKVAVAEASITGNLIASVATSTASVSSSGSSGGGGSGSGCVKYYTCPDGTEVGYCKMVKEETPIICKNNTDSNVSGEGPICSPGSVKISCKCEENPISLCSAENSTSGTDIIKCVGAGPKALLDVDMIINNQLRKHSILNLEVGEKKQVEDFTVSFLGYDYASRTGTFLVSKIGNFSCPKNCKCDENGKTIECADKCEKGKTLCPDGVCRNKCSIIGEDCKYGCMFNGKCFPMGIRSNGTYCSENLVMDSQKINAEGCENNFECKTNVCVNGKCISENTINRIMNWFRKLFGGE